MGGTPWLLKATPTVSHELVFGLGSCNIGNSRLGNRERVVGITTVFTGDGNYLLSNRSTAVPYDHYQSSLLECLRETVEIIREEQNWGRNDLIRLIFHSFKPFKDSEIEAVKSLMNELGEYDVEYAFIHFVDDHPLFVFDENNKQSKGKFSPPRGLRIPLSRYEAILSFTGTREIKRIEDGMPQPILLRLHRGSTFTDLTYLTRRAFDFSCHSWRTFSPSPLPVTILYSELIARLLKGLSDISGWDSEVMLGRIGRTRWFL
jgi:argonaute-like protein implicated in RNA metabolism and viral defense